MKRTLIILLIVTGIAALGAYFFLTKEEIVPQKESTLYQAVPLTAPVFVEISAIKNIPDSNPVLTELSAISGFQWFMQQVEQAKTLVTEDATINNSWLRRPVILAFDFVGEDKLAPVLISSIKNAEELSSLQTLIAQTTGNSNQTPQLRKYSGHKIFSIKNTQGKLLHYCAAGGLVIITPESILMDKSLRQLNSENLSDIRNFKRVNKTANPQSDVSCYINHQYFPELFTKILNNKTLTTVNEFGETVKRNFRKDILQLRNYAGWSEMDVTFHDQRISLNGVTVADDSLNHFITVFDGQQAEPFRGDEILPSNTSFYLGITFSNRERFFENLVDYFVHSNTFYDREEALKKMEKRFGSDSRHTLENMLSNQIIAASTDLADDTHESSLFIAALRARNDAQQAFEQLIKNYANSKKLDFDSLHYQLTSKNGQTRRIYRFPFPSLPEVWLGKAFAFAPTRVAAFYDDYLVFASSETTLENYFSDMDNERTLGKSRAYASFSRSIESKANINFYVNANRILPQCKQVFNATFNRKIEEMREMTQNFEAISWQMVSEKGVYFNAINMALRDKSTADGRELWAVNLGAPVATKPQIVINHTSKTEREVIVQDKNNRLHLISSTGTILWSIPISGRIISEIHQIDIYRNGKLQYLFNTDKKLYLIDRNGNNVSGFPVVFASPATNGVNVFDYDNNRNYRYFVACQNRKIYAFDKNGKPVQGWGFGQTKSAVTTPVQHFRVNHRDYIVFKDASNIYIQNRRGANRVNVSANFENSDNPLIFNTDGTPKIITSDKNGKIYYLYLDGKYAEKSRGGHSAKHWFVADDLTGNKTPDFVIVDGRKLEVHDENGKSLFSKKLDNPVSIAPHIYNFPGQKLLGLTDSKDGNIYLFNAAGKQYPGFPFQGDSAFSIGKLSGKLVLVTGNDEKLVCYELMEQ